MTREEALKVLDTIPTIGEQVDALEMAIKALEQEPCEDCISRKDFIAKVEDIYYGYMLDDDGCCPQDFVDLAEEMPSVTPQRDNSVLERVEDCISRQAVLELQKYRYNCGDTAITCVSLNSINDLPPVTPQPITLEKAIDYLHEIGWMQEHDKEMAQPNGKIEQEPKVGDVVKVVTK